MCYDMKQCRQDDELDQLKDAWWKLRDDVEHLVGELRIHMEQLKKEQMVNRILQHGVHIPPP